MSARVSEIMSTDRSPTILRPKTSAASWSPRLRRVIGKRLSRQQVRKDAIQKLEKEDGIDLNREEDRFAARKKIEALFEPKFAEKSFQDACRDLENADACWGPYQTFTQAVKEDKRVSSDNPMFSMIDQPGIGSILSAGALADFSAWPRQPSTPAPTLGQDTESVLMDVIGLSSADVGRLFDAKIVAGIQK